MLEDISSYNKTEIRVSGISLDITEDEVRTIFETFGSIKRYYYRAKPNVKYFQKRETGRMELMMELDSHIPSTLYIKDTFDFMYISYTGQPTTALPAMDVEI